MLDHATTEAESEEEVTYLSEDEFQKSEVSDIEDSTPVKKVRFEKSVLKGKKSLTPKTPKIRKVPRPHVEIEYEHETERPQMSKLTF
ncbi:unnamed protein product [Timema podura]|uniref:Uncharacterized protein n=1 Tax=Timema podura TaxID=61482 RepID=A0ABN7PAF0_TIMPD|nr:unnamed protein product [Timema podura]